jgi:hypothetical protein
VSSRANHSLVFQEKLEDTKGCTFGHCVVCTFGHCVVCTFGHCVVCTFGHCAVCTFGHCVFCSFGHCVVCTFGGVRDIRYLVFCAYFVDRCLSFCTFSVGHCVVICLRYTNSDYPLCYRNMSCVSKPEVRMSSTRKRIIYVFMLNFVQIVIVILQYIHIGMRVWSHKTMPVMIELPVPCQGRK